MLGKQIFLFIFWLVIPFLTLGQIDCKEEQLQLLQLKLMPSFMKWSTIQISCDSQDIILTIENNKLSSGLVKDRKLYKVPAPLYKEFKKVILPLGIHLIPSYSNPYLSDGLTTEITYIDRYDNFNKFVTRVPKRRNQDIYLIETIIALTQKLAIDEAYREYLDNIQSWFLDYCR